MVCVCVGGGCWVKVAAGVSPTSASDTMYSAGVHREKEVEKVLRSFN